MTKARIVDHLGEAKYMENQLYIGQVSKLLGISDNTLRFFDKEGIVHAKKAPNGYRFYDDWDINFLIEYKKYRSFGFHVEETKDILYEDSLDTLRSRIEDNEKEIEKQIQRGYMLLEYHRNYISRLEDIKNKVGQVIFTDMVEIDYFPMRYNNTYMCKPDVSELFSPWSEAFPFVEPLLVVNQPHDENYECALSIRHEYLDRIPLPRNHLVKSSVPGQAVNTVIVGGEKNTFSTQLLADTFFEIEAQGYDVAGPSVGYYLARVHEEERYCRYIDVYIPVRKKV